MGMLGMVIAIFLAFSLIAFLAIGWIREVIRSKQIELKHSQDIKDQRADAVKRSRSVIEGQVFEQLIPHFPQWNHTPSEARFIGSPIDYIVFDGMSKGQPEKISFVEVKKGQSSTSPLQNKIKKLVKEGKVEWETLKVE
jgi:predicted Holliday junction resolvase-like endonuclease